MTQFTSYIKVIGILIILVLTTSAKKDYGNKCKLKPNMARIVGGYEAKPRNQNTDIIIVFFSIIIKFFYRFLALVSVNTRMETYT